MKVFFTTFLSTQPAPSITDKNQLTINGTKSSELLLNLNDYLNLNHPLNLINMLNLNDSPNLIDPLNLNQGAFTLIGLCNQCQLLKIIPAARWPEQTAISHTVFLNGGYVLHTHTHTHLTNFKILRSSKHINVEKNVQNILM